MPSHCAVSPSPAALETLQMQPLFPVALGQVQLRPDPLDLALQLQALHGLRGAAESNPDPGCAWTGDLNGVAQLRTVNGRILGSTRCIRISCGIRWLLD